MSKNGEKYKLSISAYLYGYGLAIDLLKKIDNHYEAEDSITVNLPDVCDINTAYLNINKYPGIIDALLEHQMGRLTGRVAQSGFCEYPEFLFDQEKLRQADEAGYQKYLNQFDKSIVGKTKIYGTCSHCHTTYVFYVTKEQSELYAEYLDGSGYIQDVFPDMSPADRELLKGGSMCGKCWKNLFG